MKTQSITHVHPLSSAKTECHGSRADFLPEKCVHELFEDQCLRNAGALAAADWKRSLPYGALNDMANGLAARLVTHGIGPDVCVAVCLERGVEMIAALLAVWKAGGAYVPLDPAYPQDRLAFMLKDSQARVLLTQKSLRGNFQPPIAGCQLIFIEDVFENDKNRSQKTNHNLTIKNRKSSNLAYVIYTSGSTGQPKGVEIEHASLLNLIAWHQRTYEVKPADRAAQIASPAFDAAVWELWPYLTAGASVHFPDEETRLSPEKLPVWLYQKHITLAFAPTPLAEAMLREPWPEKCALRALLTGGDKLHRYPPKDFPCALFNHYGPTENTVVATWTEVPPSQHKNPPSIGRPIDNVQMHILDDRLRHVPVGTAGELHLGGLSLARGYRNRPELTAEKFIRDPLNARLYKTGDIVRELPDGNLEFLGRADNQVKIRGWRIELGEIEAALAAQPDVRETVVITREISGENRLVGYVVPARGTKITVDTLREALKLKLPAAMIPSAFVLLESLPLTTNGKIDRAALPTPTLESEKEFIAPQTTAEKTLAEIWREVLGVQRVGRNDNFFDLGGHSLMATQVISRVRKQFQVELPLHDLFAAPVLAQLAGKINSSATVSDRAPIARTARNGHLPISFSQERLWFLEQLEPDRALHNIPFAIRLEGKLDARALEHSLADIVRRHEPLRTVFKNENGRPLAVIEPADSFALPVTDLSPLPSTERDAIAQQLVAAEAQLTFDLARSPLLRGQLLRLAPEEHLLLLTVHHIACDGWSMGVLYRELAALYETRVSGRNFSLAELAISHADFASWQRDWLSGEVFETQLAHWKKQLASAPLALDLPTDHPRPAAQSYRGAMHFFTLPAKLSADLKALARREDVTLFMLLLGAFQVLLHRYSGQEDIVVGTPIAGRTRVETENLIGFFLNILALRSDLSGEPTFCELLQRVRRTALDAFAHQDLPFEKLVDALQLERDLSRSPLFQAMFILQNEPLRPLELAGLKLKPINVHNGTSKFDLQLSLEETNGGLGGFLEFNTDLFDESTAARMLGHFQTLLEAIVENPALKISTLPLLTTVEQKQFSAWTDTSLNFPREKCVHELFESQATQTPDTVAVTCGDKQLSYRELNARADKLADELRARGVAPDVRVGICLERSLEMMVGLLAILKAGGCYVPLDPTYPQERLAFMLEDSQARVLLTQKKFQKNFHLNVDCQLLCIDSARESRPQSEIRKPKSENLAYVIYTSGSTGKPKGVMVTHRNVVNFFAAMDRVLGVEPGVWLAVTSISFDISVLELFWTLARGFKVVIHRDEPRALKPRAQLSKPKKIDFSLFYFASDAGNDSSDKYRLLTEGAKFADENNFAAVWTPERHFHQFGGLYPNPSVTSAALAMITRRVQLRAGSVVLPVHNAVRIAEEWAVVDNLSGGRAAISIASGWHANDFALARENYSDRKEIMLRDIEMIRKIWRGETMALTNGFGQPIDVKVFPAPIQSELPVWLTSSGSAETFRLAGELGFNLLTHLSGQELEHLAKKIEIYRDAWRKSGRAGEGTVSLMLHTFVWDDDEACREKVRGPLLEYLRTYRDLSQTALSVNRNPAAKKFNGDVEPLLKEAVERYFDGCALLGTPDVCLKLVEKLKTVGVDDIACLLDFGIDTETVLASLKFLNEVRERSNSATNISRDESETNNGQWRSLPEEIIHHSVTHLQCTPSLAGTLLAPESHQAVRRLGKLLLGGEALPVSLARQLREIFPGELINMYGPTETTVWSATQQVGEVGATIPIGRPIANTEIHILDRNFQPLPIGIPGELFIGGDGVARGYLNRPELTAEKFVANPFSNDANARLYRTGDLARWRADGTIEFLGRLDHQVKLRGHRIELGEIESALRRHEDVRECVVHVCETAPDDKRLVAYVVPHRTKEFNGELRRFLEPKLPDYMIPSAFVTLDKLPLTPNGKIDRKALPQPDTHRPALENTYVAPRTDVENTITQVWRELLRVENVGVHDNFFDLGGHSLLVVQAQAKLQAALAMDLPVVKLFQYPTISALAKFIGGQSRSVTDVPERQVRKPSFVRRHNPQEKTNA